MRSWFRFTSPLPPGRVLPISQELALARRGGLPCLGARYPLPRLTCYPASHVPSKGEENLSSMSVQQGESQ